MKHLVNLRKEKLSQMMKKRAKEKNMRLNPGKGHFN